MSDEFRLEYKYLDQTYVFREPRPKRPPHLSNSDLEMLKRHGVDPDKARADTKEAHARWKDDIRDWEVRRQALNVRFIEDLAEYLGEPVRLVQKVYEYVDREMDPPNHLETAQSVSSLFDLLEDLRPLL
tara:strand:+ start:27851 stop:28237 length:387 start_codon:yes stop_codon:yes gene_type:complete